VTALRQDPRDRRHPLPDTAPVTLDHIREGLSGRRPGRNTGLPDAGIDHPKASSGCRMLDAHIDRRGRSLAAAAPARAARAGR
jgi:hypothetical protein